MTTTYERTLDCPVSADELFAWHARPGAFQRLLPPWEKVRLIGPTAEIERGERQELEMAIGPFSKRWVAEIKEVEPGAGFRDVQLSGPFAKWEHHHGMEARGDGASRLRDTVEYAIPAGGLGRAVAGGYVGKEIDRLFAYRHRITARDLRRHAEAGDVRLKVLVTGSTGLVGTALCAFLESGGHEVRRMVRSDPRKAGEFRWNPARGEFDRRALKGVDAVVHLAGENVGEPRWSEERKRRILDSRVQGTSLIAREIGLCKDGPKTLVQASAVGIYGDRGDEELTETSSHGSDFLADVCEQWERASEGIPGVRRVQLRFGVVLTPAGGALARMLPPFRAGAGGPIGSGRQWMSWIAIDDAVAAIHRALWDARLEGPVNAVAPEPVRNADFGKRLGAVLKRPAVLPLPAIAARAAFGEVADALLLASQRVLPTKLTACGFRFDEPELEGALRHLLGAKLAARQPA
ncbi:MAG: TIGR01777 family protein [Planctomycetes bacterium]|nr:TIGR01777 family oxidoreductase [Planctomycetota bacterium]MCB9902825.1 TIGR01777 family protein [Planctomycetota bacterium]